MNVARTLSVLAREARATVAARDPEKAALRKQNEEDIKNFELFLENPSSSNGAIAFAWVILTCILLSTVCVCAETIPSWEGHFIWFYMEMGFISIFTIEYLIRLSSTTRNRWEFMKEFLNVVDVMSILPFYIELLVLYVVGSSRGVPDMRVLRALRLIRIFKLGRYSEDLHFIGRGIAKSVNSFYLMGAMLSLGVLSFSALLWLLDQGEWDEKKQCYVRQPVEPHYSGCSPYQSVPNSFWWAITTMSTVGYGDTYPMSNAARVVAGFSMVVGILCVAMPTTVLSVEFATLYAVSKLENREKKVLKHLQELSKPELELILKIRAVEKQARRLREKVPHLNLMMKVLHGEGKNQRQFTASLDMLNNAALMNLSHLQAYIYQVAAEEGKEWI